MTLELCLKGKSSSASLFEHCCGSSAAELAGSDDQRSCAWGRSHSRALSSLPEPGGVTNFDETGCVGTSIRVPSRRGTIQANEAPVNSQRGGNYSLLAVLFALVLFLTAMSQRELVPWMRRVLLGLGILAAIVGVVVMFTFLIKL